MDEFLKELTAGQGDIITGFTVVEFLTAIVSSAVLSIVISLVYRQTHSGLSYSRSFVLSIIIMSVTVSFIMLIIGSNLARAFSLVGALSIVRYRNAIKDTQDISYIFLAIAVGMACGTKLYVMAVLFTAFASVLMIVLDKISFGSEGRINRLLNFSFPAGAGYSSRIDQDLARLSGGSSVLLSTEMTGDQEVLVYEVDLKKDEALDQVLEHFRTAYPNLGIKMVTGFDRFNI